jgi:hypothetical protein
MAKEQSGGRRTRRVNAWAKAAGQYYSEHKNDADIKEFSDVLKSPKFKAYYHSKYGKKKYQPSFKSTRKASRGRFGKSRRFNKFEEEEDMEEQQEIVYKGKKGKGKAKKQADDWSWGFDKNFKEEENQQEKQKEQRFQKNELFNGGKKGKNGGNNKQEQQQEQENGEQKQENQEQQQGEQE